uniref:Uncharacterized protein n=1 Tax=Rhodnius prolixus TaxID=13249 RepID=T1HL10_RHOPR
MTIRLLKQLVKEQDLEATVTTDQQRQTQLLMV